MNYGQPAQSPSFALMDRLKRYFGCGVWAGKLFVIVVVVDYLIYCFLEIMYPRAKIDLCKPWPKTTSDSSARYQDGMESSRNTPEKNPLARKKSWQRSGVFEFTDQDES
jgi:phosphatidylinositol glycan class A protein